MGNIAIMNKLNLLALCFFALSGCRYGTMNVHDALKSEYEAGIERIENAKYSADKFGDMDHVIARPDGRMYQLPGCRETFGLIRWAVFV